VKALIGAPADIRMGLHQPMNRPVAFIYWGRRGFSRFTLCLAHATREIGLNAYFSISTSNDLYSEFRWLDDALLPVDTFRTAPEALINAPRIIGIRRDLVRWLDKRGIELVITLMPHIWTPLVVRPLQRHGLRYATVFHDATPHPGDIPTGLALRWLFTEARAADTVIALSGFVRDEFIKRGIAPAERIKTVFMPDLAYPGAPECAMINQRRRYAGAPPLRALFFGRLMHYKGLALFTEAIERISAMGTPLHVSVCGEGQLGSILPRLERLGAFIINRRLSDSEIGHLLARHDLVVLTHLEASQSGIISAALGAGVPVVTTPVGGLIEQVLPRGVGLVARAISAAAIADCIVDAAHDFELYNRMLDRISATGTFSMTHFARELVAAASPPTTERKD
jgi:glycosyltransferase involved in cell wall biosynthesis